EGVMEAELVGEDHRFAILLQRDRRVAVQGVQRHREVAEPHCAGSSRAVDPAVAPVARVSARREVVLPQLGELVAAVAARLGISGIVQGRLEAVRDTRLVILRHRLVRANARRQLVEPRRIEAEHLALVLGGELLGLNSARLYKLPASVGAYQPVPKDYEA